jgi:imidazolonepropionase-like amidohydrolase
MFYPAGNAMYNELGYSFPRLYLAGGATTIRTGGSMMPYADLNLKTSIDAGRTPGPRMHVTAPYLNGPGLGIPGVHALDGPDEARRMVAYWADAGATSFKAYMHISRDELAAAIEEAHARGLDVTAHLCSVTYREAADLGIDNLEHGFFASTDFVTDKEPDRCPGGASASLAALDANGDAAQALIHHLVDNGVALTSTLTVFETSVPGRPRAPDAALDAMVPEVRDQYLRRFAQIAGNEPGAAARRFRTLMDMEVAFFRAGGLLVAGTDPTGYGGVVAGWSNQRMIELLVEAGLSPAEAIQVATLNGATHLGVSNRLGTIAPGKIADLLVVRGNPATRIADIRNVQIVFKDGIGYDPARLIEAARGSVGIRQTP